MSDISKAPEYKEGEIYQEGGQLFMRKDGDWIALEALANKRSRWRDYYDMAVLILMLLLIFLVTILIFLIII